MDKIAIASVAIGDRVRADMGDLSDLAASMADIGQLQPIILLGDTLISGARRVAAAKSLGWEEIGFVRVSDTTDLLGKLRVERDENTCRKQFTNSEIAKMAQLFLDHAGKEKAKKPPSKPNKPSLPEPEIVGTVEKAAEALGVSKATVSRSVAVAKSAEEKPENADLMDKMDVEGVRPAFDEMKRREANVIETDEQAPDVPIRLTKYFTCIETMDKAIKAARRAAKLFQDAERSEVYKLAESRGETNKNVYSSAIAAAAYALEQMKPIRPCTECGGAVEPSKDSDPCSLCNDRGYLIAEDIEE